MTKNEYTKGSANLTVIVGVILILLIGLFVFSTQTSNEPTNSPITDTTETTQIETGTTLETQEQTEVATLEADLETPTSEVQSEPVPVAISEEPVTIVPDPEPAVTQASPGVFTDYDESLLANAQNGTVILFFHASWCPSCRALENDINSDLSAIPAGVTILKIDYDTATELKKQYGVVRQHTLVQVDASGSEIKKITGLTNTLDQVVNQI